LEVGVFGNGSRAGGIKRREVDIQFAVRANSEAFANIESAHIPEPVYVIGAPKQLRIRRLE
jgi:hypothetical protein